MYGDSDDDSSSTGSDATLVNRDSSVGHYDSSSWDDSSDSHDPPPQLG